MFCILPLCLFLFFSPLQNKGQNLVTNGSFEDIYFCPAEKTCIYLAKGWLDTFTRNFNKENPTFNQLTHGCDHEMFHACGTDGWFSIPQNIFSVEQVTHHGNAYAGLHLYEHTLGGRGELIQTELIAPLMKGAVYCVDFYVIIAPRHSNYAIQQIEAYFTYDTLKTSMVTFTFPDTPSIDIFTGTLNDTVNWTRISTTYTAKGEERFFSLGTKAYKPMTAVPFSHSSQYNPTTGFSAYYFIDAISVYPCNAPVYSAGAGEERLLCLGDTTELGTHDLEQYEYCWFLPGNTTDTLSKQPRFRVAPAHTTTYVLQVTDFKFITTWDTVTVTVEECGALEMTIFPNPTTDNATFAFNKPIADHAELRIYDMAGKLVSIHPLHPEENQREFTISIIKLAKGVYTCRVAFGETEITTGKLVVYK